MAVAACGCVCARARQRRRSGHCCRCRCCRRCRRGFRPTRSRHPLTARQRLYEPPEQHRRCVARARCADSRGREPAFKSSQHAAAIAGCGCPRNRAHAAMCGRSQSLRHAGQQRSARTVNAMRCSQQRCRSRCFTGFCAARPCPAPSHRRCCCICRRACTCCACAQRCGACRARRDPRVPSCCGCPPQLGGGKCDPRCYCHCRRNVYSHAGGRVASPHDARTSTRRRRPQRSWRCKRQ